MKPDFSTIAPFTDYSGLFNCLRPDPPQGYGVFDLEPEPEHNCEQGYHDEKATREVTFCDVDGKVKTKYMCDECFADLDLFPEIKIIWTNHLK